MSDRPRANVSVDPAVARRIRHTRLVVFDFDGVFTDNTVCVHQDGTESVSCWRGDGLGLRKLERLGLPFLILSTETNPVVSTRAAKLQIRCIQALADKAAALDQVAGEVPCSLDQVAYVGNDLNDRACLAKVGFSIVVADAHPDVLGVAHYQTRTPGGRGAVREVCDLFAEVLE